MIRVAYPGSGSGSRGKKGTGSGIRIRNTAHLTLVHPVVDLGEAGDGHPCAGRAYHHHGHRLSGTVPTISYSIFHNK
jgi:hypothetical protein